MQNCIKKKSNLFSQTQLEHQKKQKGSQHFLQEKFMKIIKGKFNKREKRDKSIKLL